MHMDKIRNPAVDQPHRDFGGGERQAGEAAKIIRVIEAVAVKIGAARPVEERGRIEDQKVETGMACFQHGGRVAEQAVEPADAAGFTELGHHGGIAGHQRAHADAQGGERAGERARDIGEAAGLDQRKDLGGDRKDLHWLRDPACRAWPG